MQLSWTGLKISIAGARLSHLVQRDCIWDHGSMIEHVRTIFMQIEKCRKKGKHEFLRNYTTPQGYEFFKKSVSGAKNEVTENILENIFITEVKAHSRQSPDRFCALIKGTKIEWINRIDSLTNRKTSRRFCEEWLFLRQGDWWLLNEIKKCN